MHQRCLWQATSLLVVAGTVVLGACSGSMTATDTTTAAPPAEAAPATTAVAAQPEPFPPPFDPANFVAEVDNPYFPLQPGSTWIYRGITDGEAEDGEMVVLSERRNVAGVSAVVVQDTVSRDGEVLESTFDWYGQDRAGNVWYLGEATQELEGGEVVSTAGSWEAGVDGATPGIIMPAHPTPGPPYIQEHYAGVAEDMGQVIATGAPVEVPAGRFDSSVVTRDWTPLEPGVVEQKTYAPGVGLVHAATVEGGDSTTELVLFTPGPTTG